MKYISLVVFVVVQIIFIPLAIIGIIILAYKQLVVSKRLGVSSTAVSIIGTRWQMNALGVRKDAATGKLYQVLPNGSEAGMWLYFFPNYLRYKIYPAKREEGKEGLTDVVASRTLYFDKLIGKHKDNVGQFVSMGAGYDTRAYGDLKKSNLKFFELDQLNTQKLKIESLKKAGIDFSNVTFVDVNFSTEKWYEKLGNSGYDPRKKTIFLWEGVTLYLSEDDIRKTIKEIKEHSAPGSILVTDFYSNRLMSYRGVKTTNEMFHFALDFSKHYAATLTTFINSLNLNLNLSSYYFMGQHTKKGVIGVVAEIIL